MSKISKNIIKLIKQDSFTTKNLEELCENFTKYNLKKSDVRTIIKHFKKNYISKNSIGVFFGNLNQNQEQKIKSKYNLRDLIILNPENKKKESKNVIQSLKIDDTLYIFDIDEKIRTALVNN